MSRLNDEQLEYVRQSIHGIDYGSINITVHEGEVTQIDTTEKKRFPAKKKTKPRKQISYRAENQINYAD